MSHTEHFRADCEPTNEPTPVENSYIRDAATSGIDRTLVMGARNAVAESHPDDYSLEGVLHADDDVVIVSADPIWQDLQDTLDAHPDALRTVRHAHDQYAQDRFDDLSGHPHPVLVIPREKIADDADLSDAE